MIELTIHCHCNAIQCKTTSEIKAIVNCHCNLCRGLSGSAFNTYVVIAENEFKYIQGEESIAMYSFRDSQGKKYFCTYCGTPLFNTNPKYGPVKIVYLGSISQNQGLIPQMNIYCNYKLNWLEDIFNRENMVEGVQH
jgi:hypothetical protein